MAATSLSTPPVFVTHPNPKNTAVQNALEEMRAQIYERYLLETRNIAANENSPFASRTVMLIPAFFIIPSVVSTIFSMSYSGSASSVTAITNQIPQLSLDSIALLMVFFVFWKSVNVDKLKNQAIANANELKKALETIDILHRLENVRKKVNTDKFHKEGIKFLSFAQTFQENEVARTSIETVRSLFQKSVESAETLANHKIVPIVMNNINTLQRRFLSFQFELPGMESLRATFASLQSRLSMGNQDTDSD